MSFNSKVVWEIIRITTYLVRFLVFGFAIFTSCLLVTGLKVTATMLTLLILLISGRLSARVVCVLIAALSPVSSFALAAAASSFALAATASSFALTTTASSASTSTAASFWSQVRHGASAVVHTLPDVGDVVLGVILVDLDPIFSMVPSTEPDFMADVLDMLLKLGWKCVVFLSHLFVAVRVSQLVVVQESCLCLCLLQLAMGPECVSEVGDELLSLFALVNLNRGWNTESSESLDRFVVKGDLVVLIVVIGPLLTFLSLGVG